MNKFKLLWELRSRYKLLENDIIRTEKNIKILNLKEPHLIDDFYAERDEMRNTIKKQIYDKIAKITEKLNARVLRLFRMYNNGEQLTQDELNYLKEFDVPLLYNKNNNGLCVEITLQHKTYGNIRYCNDIADLLKNAKIDIDNNAVNIELNLQELGKYMYPLDPLQTLDFIKNIKSNGYVNFNDVNEEEKIEIKDYINNIIFLRKGIQFLRNQINSINNNNLIDEINNLDNETTIIFDNTDELRERIIYLGLEITNLTGHNYSENDIKNIIDKTMPEDAEHVQSIINYNVALKYRVFFTVNTFEEFYNTLNNLENDLKSYKKSLYKIQIRLNEEIPQHYLKKIIKIKIILPTIPTKTFEGLYSVDDELIDIFGVILNDNKELLLHYYPILNLRNVGYILCSNVLHLMKLINFNYNDIITIKFENTNPYEYNEIIRELKRCENAYAIELYNYLNENKGNEDKYAHFIINNKDIYSCKIDVGVDEALSNILITYLSSVMKLMMPFIVIHGKILNKELKQKMELMNFIGINIKQLLEIVNSNENVIGVEKPYDVNIEFESITESKLLEYINSLKNTKTKYGESIYDILTEAYEEIKGTNNENQNLLSLQELENELESEELESENEYSE